MKKGAKKVSRKASSASFGSKLRQELNLMHQATLEFIEACIDVAKKQPKGLARIKGHIGKITSNMMKLENAFARSGK